MIGASGNILGPVLLAVTLTLLDVWRARSVAADLPRSRSFESHTSSFTVRHQPLERHAQAAGHEPGANGPRGRRAVVPVCPPSSLLGGTSSRGCENSAPSTSNAVVTIVVPATAIVVSSVIWRTCSIEGKAPS